MKNLRLVAAAVVLLACLVSACGAPTPEAIETPATTPVAGVETPAPTPTLPSETPTGAPEPILVIAYAQSSEQIDPNYAHGSPAAQSVVSNCYDQLTEYELVPSEDGRYLVDDTESLMGAVADPFEVAADGMSITYHVRDGVTFHDGTPLDAEALKFMFDRIIESQGGGYGYCDLAGARTTDAFELVNDKTLVVHLEEPNAGLAPKVLTMQNIAPINPSVVREYMTDDDPFGREYLSMNEAGTGPFTLAKYDPASEIILERYDDYWKGPAQLEKVIMKIIPDAAERVLALEAGAVDIILDVPPKDVPRLEENPDITMIAAPSRGMVNLSMTTTLPPFDDVKVRQAIAYAIPYDTIVEQVYRGYAKRLRSVYTWHGSPAYTEEFWTYETDLDRAKALLEEAGYPDGFETSIAIRAGVAEDEEIAVWIRDNLEKIGVSVTIEIMPAAAWVTKGRAHELPLFVHHRLSFVDDPFYAYYWYVLPSVANMEEYENPEVTDLVYTYAPSGDPEARLEAARRIQEILCEELPVVPLVQPTYNVAMRSNVHGYYYAFDGNYVTRFYTLYLEE